MNRRIKKMLVKGVIGFGVSALIGYVIKLEQDLEADIDANY